MRRLWWVCLGLVAALCLGAGRADATVPPDTVDPLAPIDTTPVTTAPPVTMVPGPLPPAAGPLVVVPPGCAVPASASAVFIGQLIATDQPPSTARFHLDSILSGSLDGYVGGGDVDVRYGEEAKFLTLGTHYVIGVTVDNESGVLLSTVREAAPLFAGDAVIGANDSDIDCPRVEDPVRTLLVDGRPVDTGVLTPLKGHSGSLLAAVLKPLIIAFGVLVALVLLKHLLFATGRSVRETVDSIGAVQHQRPPRRRRHGAAEPESDQSLPEGNELAAEQLA